MTKRLMVVAGGTGGHIFPGIAVAQQLQAEEWEVSWLGTADRMEAEVVPKHDIDIDFIKVQGLRGNGVTRLLKAPVMLLAAVKDALKIIRHRKPDVVLTMGGYVTGPAGIAVKLAGIPLVIHEQNAVAGMSNKLLSRIANRVLVAFDGAFAAKHSEVVGNPVRASVSNLKPKVVGHDINLLIVGGSLGAQIFNQVLPEALNRLNTTLTSQRLCIRHQTGKNNKSTVEKSYHANSLDNVQIDEFIDDIDAAYEWADIVICRAGALTVSEIAAAGKLAIFVPFPHAVDDHQTANAKFLVDQDAAVLLPQAEFNEQNLVSALHRFIEMPKRISDMAAKAKQCAKPEAAQKVAFICKELAE